MSTGGIKNELTEDEEWILDAYHNELQDITALFKPLTDGSIACQADTEKTLLARLDFVEGELRERIVTYFLRNGTMCEAFKRTCVYECPEECTDDVYDETVMNDFDKVVWSALPVVYYTVGKYMTEEPEESLHDVDEFFTYFKSTLLDWEGQYYADKTYLPPEPPREPSKQDFTKQFGWFFGRRLYKNAMNRYNNEMKKYWKEQEERSQMNVAENFADFLITEVRSNPGRLAVNMDGMLEDYFAYHGGFIGECPNVFHGKDYDDMYKNLCEILEEDQDGVYDLQSLEDWAYKNDYDQDYC